MFKLYVVGLLLIFLGCKSSPKAQVPDTLPTMQYGVFVKFFDLGEAEALTIAKEFESQAQAFRDCGSDRVEFHIKFEFDMAKYGRIKSSKVLSMAPGTDPLKECFTKHIKALRLESVKKPLRGEAHIGSYL